MKALTPTIRRYEELSDGDFSKKHQRKGSVMAKKRAKARRKTKTKAKRRGGGGITKMTYSLSPELAVIIGAKKATRPMVMKKIWVYIKARKLQDAKNRRMINPDAKLGEVLGKRPINMLKMAGALNKHIG